MKLFIFNPGKKVQRFFKSFVLACFFSSPLLLVAQPSYTFSSSTGNTYNVLTTPTELYGGDEDDKISASTAIGFTFTYNGIPYSDFKVSTNGFINIGGELPYEEYAHSDNSLSSTIAKFILAPLWDDLYVNSLGSIGYKLTGSSGSYILKIEFKDIDFWDYDENDIYGASTNFQVWLYEGSNVVEFRYGEMGTWTGRSASIGINDENDNSFLSVTPAATPTYSSSTPNDEIATNANIISGLMYSFTPIQWLGNSTDWASGSNWSSNEVPDASTWVVIPSGKSNYPILNENNDACKSLTIDAGGSVNISSDGDLTISENLFNSGLMTVTSTSETSSGSLIVSGTSSGNITYERYLTGVTSWHMVAAPVEGQDIWTYATAPGNSIATNESKRAITTYNEGTDDWNIYPEADPSASFISGIGYSTLRATDGIVSFTGTVNTNDVSGIILTRGSNGWNLLGNPYPSAINATTTAHTTNNFLTVNSSDLDPSYGALYLWDLSTTSYKTINNSGGGGELAQHYIQAGQGFFVKSKTGGGTVDITEAMQSHQGTVPFKSTNKPWPTINLITENSNGNDYSNTLISFSSDMTLGLDVTYDAGMFKNNPDFALYSRLVNDNGVDFAVQCLPENYESLVIPIGLDAPAGTEVTFHAELTNLPLGCKPCLEDRIAGIITPLDKPESSYSVILNDKNRGLGAFYLHTSNNNITNSQTMRLDEPFQITVHPQDGFIRVISSENLPSLAQVFDISGRIVAVKEIHIGSDNLVYMQERPGIYIIRIRSEKQIFNQKLFWYK